MKTYSLRKHLIKEKLEGKTILFDSTKSVLYTLNETASFILKHILMKKSVSDVTNALVKMYGKKPESVEKDVRACLSRLIKDRIVVPQKKEATAKK
jgi:hypothetical protein